MPIDATSPTSRPRRAEPLQPDKPVSGDDAQSDKASDKASDKDGGHDTQRQMEQEKAALDNVRKGYD